MTRHPTPTNEIRPCPCCGNPNLMVGRISSDSFGVHCLCGTEDYTAHILLRSGNITPEQFNEEPLFRGCGLKMEVPVPSEYPDDFPEHLQGMDAINHLDQLTLDEAIDRWNQRAGH